MCWVVFPYLPIGVVFLVMASVIITETPGETSTRKLHSPNPTPSVTHFPKVYGRPQERTPTPVQGFPVSTFARNTQGPCRISVLPRGDMLKTRAEPLSLLLRSGMMEARHVVDRPGHSRVSFH